MGRIEKQKRQLIKESNKRVLMEDKEWEDVKRRLGERYPNYRELDRGKISGIFNKVFPSLDKVNLKGVNLIYQNEFYIAN
jgi:hypothetical protein